MTEKKRSKAEERAIALSAVRGTARHRQIDPLTLTVDDALAILDDLNRVEPELVACQWYRAMSDRQYRLLCQEWAAWQQEARERQPARREALLVVHLSSLDSYTFEKGDAQGAWLAEEMESAIKAYPGLIVVTDQEWDLIGKCQPRMVVVEALQSRARVIRFHHDEDTDEWDEAMQRLGHLLRGHGITHLILGGVWASADDAEDSEGCVNETCRQLEKQGFFCSINKTITGMIED